MLAMSLTPSLNQRPSLPLTVPVVALAHNTRDIKKGGSASKKMAKSPFSVKIVKAQCPKCPKVCDRVLRVERAKHMFPDARTLWGANCTNCGYREEINEEHFLCVNLSPNQIPMSF